MFYKWICSAKSLWDCSMLIYRNKIFFWLLIYYPTSFLNLFMNHRSHPVDSWDFPIKKIMSPVTRDIFIVSFSIWMPFYSYITVLARTSSTMLNVAMTVGILVLCLDVRGKVFSLLLEESGVKCSRSWKARTYNQGYFTQNGYHLNL